MPLFKPLILAGVGLMSNKISVTTRNRTSDRTNVRSHQRSSVCTRVTVAHTSPVCWPCHRTTRRTLSRPCRVSLTRDRRDIFKSSCSHNRTIACTTFVFLTFLKRLFATSLTLRCVDLSQRHCGAHDSFSRKNKGY